MNIDFLITFFLPIISGLFYFYMSFEVKRIAKFRAIMFGEIGFKKLQFVFAMFAIYFITRPLQNLMGPHPMPMLINSLRQLFLMAFIAPSILVAIFHWAPTPSGAPKSSKFASYAVGILMGIIFVLTNSIIAVSSKVIFSYGFFIMYDPVWASNSDIPMQLVAIHLICQLISPVGFFVLSVAYIKHRRHNYQLAHFYNMMLKKWKFLEVSLIIFALSFIIAGAAAAFGQYYTYLWSIYFVGAIISGIFSLRSVVLPPRKIPNDLQ
jgi:hypothetical protein